MGVQAPRPPPRPRDGTAVRRLALRPEERLAREQVLSRFVNWMAVAAPTRELGDLARHDVPSLCELLQEFSYQSFETRWPTNCLRQLLTGVVDRYGWVRGSLSGPWKVVCAIERTEPSIPRAPLPLLWLQAFVVTALSFRSWRMASALLLGFFALLRPAELYGLRRSDILMETEHFMGHFILVRVLEPKSRWKGARQQYVRVDHPLVVQALQVLLGRLSMQDLIWPWSPGRFALRLKRLSQAVTGNPTGVLPSSLRTGGATWLFQSTGEDLPRLLWRGRWRDARVLASYIQEVTAAMLAARLPETDARRIKELADFFEPWLSVLRIEDGAVAIDDC